jgi:FtsX-like permease family protein
MTLPPEPDRWTIDQRTTLGTTSESEVVPPTTRTTDLPPAPPITDSLAASFTVSARHQHDGRRSLPPTEQGPVTRSEQETMAALGASGRQVFWLMMVAGQLVALAGVVVGLAVAYVGGRLVASSVYAMRASDPPVLFTAGAIVAIVTFAATMVPSIKASRLDPVQALRPE